jgi:hypothetical protein
MKELEGRFKSAVGIEGRYSYKWTVGTKGRYKRAVGIEGRYERTGRNV